MNPQNPLEDVRYIRTASNEDILARKVERKPDGPPKSKRNYKELEEKPTPVAKKSRSIDDDDAPVASIFDLSRKSRLERQSDISPDDEEGNGESNAGLAKTKLAGVGKNVEKQKSATDDQESNNSFSSEESDSINTITASTSSSLQSQSISMVPVPPPIAPEPIQNNNVTAPVIQTHRVDLQEIIDQITDKIYTLKVSGKMDTTIEFKYPVGHLFEGMKVTVTSYDTAAKEFNISFTHLTQEAKVFFESNDVLNGLKQILDSRGVLVHMILPTTQATTSIMAEQKSGKEEQELMRENQDQQRPKK